MIEISFSNDYNMILIIIYKLVKERYYILYITNKDCTTAKVIAYLLFNNVKKL